MPPYIPLEEFDEGSSARYTATLLDEDGAAVQKADLVSIELWLRDVASGQYLNNRNAQNVLDAHGVTFHDTSGLLTWQLAPADNAIVGDSSEEIHEFIFRVVWDEGNKAKVHRRYIKVKNMVPIT